MAGLLQHIVVVMQYVNHNGPAHGGSSSSGVSSGDGSLLLEKFLNLNSPMFKGGADLKIIDSWIK